MAFLSVNKLIVNDIFFLSYTVFRYVRNVSRRGSGPKFLEGTVKTVTNYENTDFSKVENYADFVKKVKSINFSELDIEEALTREDDFRSTQSQSTHQKNRDDEDYNRYIKKKIIGRKYVQMEKETNLLTYAAKVQIRYLQKINPNEWTPEFISQHFPITVNGVKKLLKSNFVLTSPERIRAHDEEVAKRWEILESGKSSDSISLYTQCLWDAGKITKQNYQGNPNFPSVSTHDNNKIILNEEKKKTRGEYSAIIQQYINYKEKKESSQGLSSKNELQVMESSKNYLKNSYNKNKFNLFKDKNKYHLHDESDDTVCNKGSGKLSKNSKFVFEADVLHNQFKDNLMDETYSEELTKWMQEQSKESVLEVQKTSQNTHDYFVKIPKYRKEFMEVERAETKIVDEHINPNSEKIRYSHPKHNNIKSKINLPANSHKRKALYKVGQCVYDEYGEFLYKLSS